MNQLTNDAGSTIVTRMESFPREGGSTSARADFVARGAFLVFWLLVCADPSGLFLFVATDGGPCSIVYCFSRQRRVDWCVTFRLLLGATETGLPPSSWSSRGTRSLVHREEIRMGDQLLNHFHLA